MTTQETELLLVTEADRDAAAQYLRYCGKITEHSFGDMQNGKWDASEYVQAFARHRLQSLEQAKPSASGEAGEHQTLFPPIDFGDSAALHTERLADTPEDKNP